MKTIKSIIAFTLLVVGFVLFSTSCKKDTPAPLKTLDGKFLGHFKITGDPTENYMSFSFNSDNTLIVYTEDNFGAGAGSWSLAGDVITGEFFYNTTPGTKFTFTAIYNPKTGEIASGTWGFKPNVAGAATFTMTKQEAERYEGEFLLNGSAGKYPFAIELYPDNSLLIFDDQLNLKKPSGSGTYVVVNNTVFAANIKLFVSPVKYAYTASKSATTLSNGTWGVYPTNTGEGTWNATKKNNL
jgi:ABC-type cobalt transport system substrate-binding protein